MQRNYLVCRLLVTLASMTPLHVYAGQKSSEVVLVSVLVVCYSLCSSMLLILNKVRQFRMLLASQHEGLW